MPAITKRKTARVASQKNTIQKFGKITKSQPAQAALLKQLEFQQNVKEIAIPTTNKPKRKADALDEGSLPQEPRFAHLPVTPRKKARKIRSNVGDTPTSAARSLFQAFSIGASEPSCDHVQLETPPPSQEPEESEELPSELQQMVDLNSCFLTAMSLHYAHNGLLAPADLRNLCPNVARGWRLRKVDQTDIQRLLALQNRPGHDSPAEAKSFDLKDYNQGKTCVELHGDENKHTALDEKKLNARFVENLQAAWKEYNHKTAERFVLEFIADLPLAPITTISSIVKIAASLSKGQQQLAEMKAGAIKAQERAAAVTFGSSVTEQNLKPKSRDPFERSMSLKSRIFAKQQQNANGPTPLTPEQMARRSALLRLAEVAPVLQSLALGRQRHRNDDADEDPFKRVASQVSFTLPTLIQNMQMSLRNPIDRNEGRKCLRLLAEIAPEWIGIREIGSVIGVTIGGQGIGKVVLARRVDDALLKL